MGNDECPLTLDDAGGVLGHAYFPDSSGTCREIHLDINERWYFGNNPNIPKNQTSFLMVLVHEIGHALGIAHSASPNAIMFAFYQHEIRGLDVDDINAVQYLYGRKNKYDSIPTSTTASAIPKTTTTIRSTTQFVMDRREQIENWLVEASDEEQVGGSNSESELDEITQSDIIVLVKSTNCPHTPVRLQTTRTTAVQGSMINSILPDIMAETVLNKNGQSLHQQAPQEHEDII
ncbi:unnamed protein product [Acanthoscelides obtectus]|uniref:Peptidase M10 metallopeptidase domain-containing protein n=1 Tax=Acanthoscelides obtectus TaxID=200917 RepID=A0A9P0M7B2_ACAOB|nr:unnamed protein product [Acanthoscelides obtectus]CAK1673022.1 Putative metalloproteinase 165R [Acanthoscelides obtectus]